MCGTLYKEVVESKMTRHYNVAFALNELLIYCRFIAKIEWKIVELFYVLINLDVCEILKTLVCMEKGCDEYI